MKKYFYTLILLLFSLIAFQSKASHFTGSDISYQCTSTSGVYKVSLKLYRDCSGIQLCNGCGNAIPNGTTSGCTVGTNGTQIIGASPICLGTNFGTFTLAAVSVTSGYDIIQTCTSIRTICTNCNTRTTGTYTPGIEVYVFEGNINLNTISPSCCNITLSYSDCCRNGSLTTIVPGQFYTQATINRCQTPCNSAPTFTNDAVPLVCAGVDFVYNLGANDPDGDSLSYAFGESLASQGSSVTYIAPYNAAYPFPYLGAPNANGTYPAGLRIDPKTGDIMFRPIGVFVGQLVIEVTQWKSISGVWTNVGMTRRDVQFQTRFCANNLPPLVQVNGIGSTINTSNFLIFAGQQFCLDIVATDQENLTSTPTILADTTDLTWNNPGLYSSVMSTATFTRNYILGQRGIYGPKADSFKFCWTPPISAIRPSPFLFTFSGSDRFCPLRSVTTKGIAITVVKPKTVIIDSTIKNTFCNNRINATNINYKISSINLVSGNVLTVELSDSSGSFTNATNIGTKTTTDTIGFIPVNFPSGLFTNSQYKIRINASSDTINLGTPYAVNFVVGFNTPVISANKDSICKGLVSTFKVTPNTVGLTYKWLKNNVIIANQTKDSLLVDSAYNYRAIVSNSGCSDTSNIKYLTVNPLPKAGFTINNASQCLNGNNFIFSDTSKVTNGVTNRLWTLNTDTSTNITFIKTLNNAGTFPIKLLTVSEFGCKDSLTKTITIYPKPNVGFTINNSSQCVNGNNFSFSDFTTIATGTLTRKWNLGTGINDTSLLATVNKSYSIDNIYIIKLIVSSNFGCKDSISKTIVVHPKPAVNFGISYPTQCLKGNSFSFTDSSSITNGTISRKWNFGTNNLDTSTYTNPIKNYTTANTYTVKLVATSNNNCKDSVSKSITVNPQPNAIITAIGGTTFCANKNLILKANQAAGQSYLWLKNDSLIPQYNDSNLLTNIPGNYQLIIKSAFNCIDTSVGVDIITYPVPTVNYTISNPIQCLKGNSFSFTDSSSITNGTISRKWNFGTNNLDTSTYTNPIKNYTTANTYTVKLVATSNNNCKDSVSKSIIVNPQPNAIITAIGGTAFCANKNLILKANQAAGQSYLWLKNDSLIPQYNDSNLQTNIPGNYQLIIKSAFNCIDTSVGVDIITYPVPTVNYTISNPIQCLKGNSFSFTDSSSITNGTISRKWNFGTNNLDTSTYTNPIKNYTTANTYAVKLVATSNNNCKDSVSKSITVNPQPNAIITAIGGTAFCANKNVILKANQAAGQSYLWLKNDSLIPQYNDSNLLATTAGNYQLVIKTIFNCIDTSAKTALTVNPLPFANFTINNPEQCLSNNLFSFVDSSSILTGTLTRKWNFGTNALDTSSLILTTKAYTIANTYVVKLISISNNNCMDSIVKTVVVNPQPKAGFTINSDSQCVNNNSFVFTDTTINNTNVWNTGISNNQITKVATQTYTNVGNYTIKQVVKSVNNCIDSTSKSIYVEPKPIAGIISGQTTGLIPSTPYAYTIPQQLNHTYNWIITNGIVTAGQGTNAATVQWISAGNGTANVEIKNILDCSDTANLAVNITTVGINNLSLDNDLKVYPNPTKTIITITNKTNFTGKKYIITNLVGQTVLSGKLNLDETIVNLESLQSGLYLLSIDGLNKQSIKVIKE